MIFEIKLLDTGMEPKVFGGILLYARGRKRSRDMVKDSIMRSYNGIRLKIQKILLLQSIFGFHICPTIDFLNPGIH
jgi:hypothetical protein